MLQCSGWNRINQDVKLISWLHCGINVSPRDLWIVNREYCGICSERFAQRFPHRAPRVKIVSTSSAQFSFLRESTARIPLADNLWRKVICDVSPQNMCKRIMKLVGRKKEIGELENLYRSGQALFFGRGRVNERGARNILQGRVVGALRQNRSVHGRPKGKENGFPHCRVRGGAEEDQLRVKGEPSCNIG